MQALLRPDQEAVNFVGDFIVESIGTAGVEQQTFATAGFTEEVTLSRGGLLLVDQNAQTFHNAHARDERWITGTRVGKPIHPGAPFPEAPAEDRRLAVLLYDRNTRDEQVDDLGYMPSPAGYYLYLAGIEGNWRPFFLPRGEVTHHSPTGVDTYHMGEARAQTPEQTMFMPGVCQRIQQARNMRIAQATVRTPLQKYDPPTRTVAHSA